MALSVHVPLSYGQPPKPSLALSQTKTVCDRDHHHTLKDSLCWRAHQIKLLHNFVGLLTLQFLIVRCHALEIPALYSEWALLDLDCNYVFNFDLITSDRWSDSVASLVFMITSSTKLLVRNFIASRFRVSFLDPVRFGDHDRCIKMLTLQLNDQKVFLIRSICDRCHKLKSNRVASSMWRHNVIKFFAVTLRVRYMSTSKNIFWCVRSRSLRLMALRLFPQTTHRFTSFLSDQSRQLLLELFLSRKSFSSSGINTPASQPCRPCRWRVAVTPFRSELMGVALRLGLRTLASLASLRTLVVFLPSAVLVVQNYNCWLLLVILGRFRDPRKRAKKGLFLGVSKTTLFSRFLTSLTSHCSHQLIIKSSSTHHFIINFTHHITSYNSSTLQWPQKHDFGTPKTPLFWPLKNTPFLTPKTLFFIIIKIIIINVINTSSETSKITFFSFFNFFKNRKLFFKSAN